METLEFALEEDENIPEKVANAMLSHPTVARVTILKEAGYKPSPDILKQSFMAAMRDGKYPSAAMLIDYGLHLEVFEAQRVMQSMNYNLQWTNLKDQERQKKAESLDTIVAYLIKAGADINLGHERQDSLVDRIVDASNAEALEVAFKHGAKVPEGYGADRLRYETPRSVDVVLLSLKNSKTINDDAAIAILNATLEQLPAGKTASSEKPNINKQQSQAKAIKILEELAAKTDFDANQRLAGDLTPLMIATMSGSADVMHWLIDHGASKNAIRHQVRSRVYFSNNRVSRIYGYNVYNGSPRTALEYAIVGGYPEAAAMLCKGIKADSLLSREALLWAAYFNNTDVAKLLLKAGVRPDARDSAGDSALALAAFAGAAEMVPLLIEHGADPNAIRGEAETGMPRFLRYSEWAPLPLAISRLGNGNEVQRQRQQQTVRALLKAGADPAKQPAKQLLSNSPFYHTPVYLAWKRDKSMLPELLKYGADPNLGIKKSAYNPVLVEAVRANDHDTVDEMLAYGASPNAGASMGWRRTLTPVIQMATQQSRVKMVQLLLAYGASVPASAIEVAASKGDVDILELLKNPPQKSHSPGWKRSKIVRVEPAQKEPQQPQAKVEGVTSKPEESPVSKPAEVETVSTKDKATPEKTAAAEPKAVPQTKKSEPVSATTRHEQAKPSKASVTASTKKPAKSSSSSLNQSPSTQTKDNSLDEGLDALDQLL